MSDYMRALRAKVGTDLVQIPAAGAAVWDEHGRLLLVRHLDPAGVWSIPGGAIDPHETPADAVVREAWEELGVRAEPRRLVGVYGGPEYRVVYENGDQVSYLVVVFECRLFGQLRPDGEEIDQARFVSAPELASLELTPWLVAVGPQLVRGGGAGFAPAAWSPPGGVW